MNKKDVNKLRFGSNIDNKEQQSVLLFCDYLFKAINNVSFMNWLLNKQEYDTDGIKMEIDKYNEYIEQNKQDEENKENKNMHYDNSSIVYQDKDKQFNISLISSIYNKYIKSIKSSPISINFGVSPLLFLRYGESPIHSSLKSELINHSDSTIDIKLYTEYEEECKLKILTVPNQHWTLNEMISIKIYTDTTVSVSYTHLRAH